MLDLFDTPLLPGLSSVPDIVTEAEERALIAAIDATNLSPFRFQGWTGKRLTTSFGGTMISTRARWPGPIPCRIG